MKLKLESVLKSEIIAIRIEIEIEIKITSLIIIRIKVKISNDIGINYWDYYY